MQHIKNGNTALEKDNTAGQKGTSAGTGATQRDKRATLCSAVPKRPRMNPAFIHCIVMSRTNQLHNTGGVVVPVMK